MEQMAMPTVCLALLLLLQLCSGLAVSNGRSAVKHLPGFQGPLPFDLETGYVGVDESEEVQLFYYFVKSQGNAKEDPLLLWLTGGPGCSALSGLVYEIGPLNFNVEEYNGSLPMMVLNPYSWTQVSSIIFVDLPVGTGFSYSKTQLSPETSDSIQVYHAYQFLRKWLQDHPEFRSNLVYIGGDSYSGMIVPAVVQAISSGNAGDINPLINLKGYILGNPSTDTSFDDNSKVPFAHGMGLISDELFESLKESCRGEYQTIAPGNAECLKHVREFDKCTSGVEHSHILERRCAFVSPRPFEIFVERSQDENARKLSDSEPSLPTIGCRTYGYLLAKYWANDKNVRKALGVREGSIGEWQRCQNGMPYVKDIHSAIEYHVDLGKKGFRRLIYSGDHDMLVSFVGTQAWIRSLNYSIVDDWRAWYLQGQVAGYTRTYSNLMTYATLKGAGHTAPEYKPAECFAMFRRWMHQEPL
ncbi:hypothetical protein Tsubulata_027206 [Turnera subulata]|uniref:Uncharacterized protein n=1 Tax=Turnera subulata TaxID=218843 RepID=A0A9Q0JJB4_9ROSI|nr:hypothetical protein Tsubulata_027206 [Turnera subulata]